MSRDEEIRYRGGRAVLGALGADLYDGDDREPDDRVSDEVGWLDFEQRQALAAALLTVLDTIARHHRGDGGSVTGIELTLDFDTSKVVIQIPPNSVVIANGHHHRYAAAGQFTVSLTISDTERAAQLAKQSDETLLQILADRLRGAHS